MVLFLRGVSPITTQAAHFARQAQIRLMHTYPSVHSSADQTIPPTGVALHSISSEKKLDNPPVCLLPNLLVQPLPTNGVYKTADEHGLGERRRALFKDDPKDTLSLDYAIHSLNQMAYDDSDPVSKKIAGDLLNELIADASIPPENKARLLQVCKEYIRKALDQTTKPLFAHTCDVYRCQAVVDGIGKLLQTGNEMEQQVATEVLLWLRTNPTVGDPKVAILATALNRVTLKVAELNAQGTFVDKDLSKFDKKSVWDLYVKKIGDGYCTLSDLQNMEEKKQMQRMYNSVDPYESAAPDDWAPPSAPYQEVKSGTHSVRSINWEYE